MNLYLEFDEIVRAFHRDGVRYAVIGGFAVGMYGFVRGTEDLDFMIVPEDIDQVQSSLKELGYLLPKAPWTFRSSQITLWRFVHVKENGDVVVVDIQVPSQEEHIAMVTRAIPMSVHGVPVPVVGREDLIALKRERMSSKDRIDIDFLTGETDVMNETHAEKMIRRVAEASELGMAMKAAGFEGGLHQHDPRKVKGPATSDEVFYSPVAVASAQAYLDYSRNMAASLPPEQRRRLGFEE